LLQGIFSTNDTILNGVIVAGGYIARVVPAGGADAFTVSMLAWAASDRLSFSQPRRE